MIKEKTLQIVSWKEIKHKIFHLNPLLCREFDKFRGINKFKVILAKYPFADEILVKGKFRLHIDGENISYKNHLISDHLKNLLDYHWRTLPFGMVTHNTIESHIDHSTHIMPFMLLRPGKTFALLSMFDKHEYSNLISGLYSTTSGCRSLILLPKICHQQSNERLTKHYLIEKHLSPQNLSEHWLLLKELSQSTHFHTNWYSEVIFFSKEFIDAIEKTPTLSFMLLQNVWEAMSFNRNLVTHDFIWSIFLQDLPLSLKHDPLIIETVKHLILIAMKEVPGYAPADSNLPGPISDFTRAFLDIYKLRFHLPIFMQLEHYNGSDAIYYTLQKHTFFHEIPEQAKSRQTINDLIKIKSVLLQFRDYILKNKFEHSLEKTILYKTMKDTEFDFFHPKADQELISNIGSIAKDDKRFYKLPYKGKVKEDLSFPTGALFFHGCIRIRPKNDSKSEKA